MKAQGISETQVGLIISAGGLITIIAQPL